jgi:hypothetical protein
MKRIKIAGLCLIAVFAFGALAAASASAKTRRPKYYKCVKAPKVGKKFPTGEFANKECTKAKAEGEYRLEELEGENPLTTKSKTTVFKVDGKVVKCTKDVGNGHFLGNFEIGEETITFSGCDINENKKEPCQNITTHPLQGELYYTSKAETEAAIEFSGANFVFAEIKCGAETFVIEGQAVGLVKNSKTGQTITFAVNAGGEQALKELWVEEEYEGSHSLECDGKEATLQTTEDQGPKGVGVYFEG